MLETAGSAQKNEILTALRSILSDLLHGMPAEGYEETPLIEMGANSLIMMEFIRSIEKNFGVRLQVRQFFQELSTPALLAEYLSKRSPAGGGNGTACGAAATSPGKAPSLSAFEMPEVGNIPIAGDGSGLEGIFADQLQSASRTLEGIVERQLRFLRGREAAETVKEESASITVAAAQPPIEEHAPRTAASVLPSWKVAEIRARGLTAQQKEHLETFTERYSAKTAGSKRLAARYRPKLADNRASAGFRFTTKELLYPVVGSRAAGSRIWDVDGNEYVDLTMGFGVNLFGHNPDFLLEALRKQMDRGIQLGPQAELAGDVAESISRMTGMDRVAFCNTGTEAVMTALRLVRTVTERRKVAVFQGSYHGHFDGTLGMARDPERDPAAVPVTGGIVPGMVSDLMVLEYGHPRSLDHIRRHGGELAAVLVEPVQSRRPDLQPKQFLADLRALTRELGIALIFDEMITGFRLHPAGAQGWYGIGADMGTYGKVIGGGMPIGVVAGKTPFMDALDGGSWSYGDASYPASETTFFAGTFNKHPLALAAAAAVVNHLESAGPELQETLNRRTEGMVSELNALFEETDAPMHVSHCGSQFRFDYEGNLDLFFYHLLHKGVFVWEGRNFFLSTAHGGGDITSIVSAVGESLDDLRSGGFLPQSAAAGTGKGSGTIHRYRLTESQRQLWILSEMDPDGSLAYNITAGFHLRGSVDEEALELAVRRIVSRHDALRTVIEADGEYQRVLPEMEIPLGRVDLCAESGSAPPDALGGWFEEESRTPFEFDTGPMIRFTLLGLGEVHHVLAVSAHHMLVDGMSLGIIIRELCRFYEAASSDGRLEIESTPLQFGDFASWLGDRLASAKMDEHRSYWKGVLEDPPPPMDLAPARPRPSIKTFGCRRRTELLGPGLLEDVRRLSGEMGTTPFVVLLGAYLVLLHRLSGQKDLLAGIPVAMRSMDGSEGLVGYCTHMLPVRSSFEGDPSASEYLASLSSVWFDAVEHAQLPFADLLNELDVGRDPARPPLVGVLFNMDRAPEAPGIRGMETEWISPPITHAAYDLFFNIIEMGDHLALECDFNEDLFGEETIRRILYMYRNLLADILENPERAISRLSLMDGAEREKILTEWSSSVSVSSSGRCLHDLIREQAAKTPDANAVTAAGRSVTYAELNERSDALAAALMRSGAGPDIPVGLCTGRTPEMIVGILAILKAGSAYLPLEGSHPKKRISFMIEDAKAPVILSEGCYRGRFEGMDVAVLGFDAPSEGRRDLTGAKDPKSLAYVMYTSGSMGTPKGVMVEHRNVVNLVRGLERTVYSRYGMGLNVALVAPYVFDASVQQIFAALILGHSLCIASEEERKDGRELKAFLRGNSVDVSDGTPAHLRMLCEEEAGTEFPPVRHYIIGGETLTKPLMKRFFEACSGEPPLVTNVYGPTECCVDSTWFNIAPQDLDNLDEIPIGRPLPGQRVYVLNEAMEPQPAGLEGEVHIGGHGVSRGYIGPPERTASRFVPDPYSEGERLYRTGDLALWREDGALSFRGRRDQQVKVRGYRIELGEVESNLLDFRRYASESASLENDLERVRSISPEAFCSKCGLPSNVPGIAFDAAGVCSECCGFGEWREKADAYFRTPAELLDRVLRLRGKAAGPHDCLLLYSGGKDSSYVLYRLLDMGLRVLTFTFDNGFISETALENVRRTTKALGLESITMTVDRMDEIFSASLDLDHTVCTGCFQALTALSTQVAWERGIPLVVTGLSRGQILDTKLNGILTEDAATVEDVERRLLQYRQAYHRRDDRINRLLGVEIPEQAFEDIRFFDYFRYDDVTEDGINGFLARKDPLWNRPGDTGFCSTNCLVNEVGIFVHLRDLGFHNYAVPMSWECRIGHRHRDAVINSLRFDTDPARLAAMLERIRNAAGRMREAVVLDIPDAQGQKTLCAYVASGLEIPPSELRTFLEERLPEYMIPSFFVHLSRVPRTSAGKVDRSALPDPRKDVSRDPAHLVPETPLQQLAADAWEEVLGIENVGMTDHFFELGGHSLMATQVCSRLRPAISAEVPLRGLFENPRLVDFCRYLESLLLQSGPSKAPPLRAVRREGEPPLSFAQQRLWFLEQFEGESAAYNIPGAVRIRGSLDVGALTGAVESIIRRHETLRTRFPSKDGSPVQCIAPEMEISIPTINLAEVPPADRDAEIRRVAGEEAAELFDLAAGPLVRLKLIRAGDRDHVLLVTMHHIISDGWSLGVFSRELAAHYSALSGHSNRGPDLQDLPVQYSDFSRWQREWLAGDALETQLRFWTEHLKGAPALLNLPTDRPRPAIQTFRGDTYRFEIDAETGRRIRSTARRHSVTPFMILIAAYASLLHRYSRQEDLVIGTPIANRTRSELEPLIGFFVNTLSLRFNVRGSVSFEDLLIQIRRTSLEGYANQDVPFERIVEEIQPERNLGHNPIFQTLFILQNTPEADIDLHGLTIEPMELDNLTSKFDMTLSLEPAVSGGFKGEWEYNADLFGRTTVERMARHFRRLLGAALDRPESTIAELPLMDAKERQSVLECGKAATGKYPKERCCHGLFEDQVNRRGQDVAVEFRGEKISYGELNRRAECIAESLRRRSVGPESCVGICMRRSADMVAALLGVMKSGGAYVPIDPAYPGDRLAFMVQDSGARFMISERGNGSFGSMKGLEFLDPAAMIASEAGTGPDRTVGQPLPSSLAYVIYTSGSTGRPKGVEVGHRSLVNFLSAMAREPGFGPDDTILAVTTLSFDISALELLLPLVMGGRIVLADEDEASDGSRLASLLSKSGATVMQATPATWRMLFSSGWRGDPDLKVLCGGEALPAELAEELAATCGEVWNLYGPTETTVWSALCRISPEDPARGSGMVVPIGFPIANTVLHVLDPDTLAPLPEGIPGELFIGGDGVARGYRGRPELTANRFIPNPFEDGEEGRLYRTGDLVRRLSSGSMAFLGRLDDQVKVRGFRIEPAEVEAVLCSHEGVRSAAVAVREDASGDNCLAGYVVPDPEYLEGYGGGEGALEGEHAAEWEDVWDEIYDGPDAGGRPDFDIRGWIDSSTGLSIPEEQMGEWVDRTTERILSLGPRRVLEIGCGTGLFVSRIAPRCATYWAIDSSRKAIEAVLRLKDAMPGLENVFVEKRAAGDLDGLDAEDFDVVILNSVIQYFPGEAYLTRILGDAGERLAPGGYIFVGDVRSLRFLRAHHAMVAVKESPADLVFGDLAARVRRLTAQEEELLVDPLFFSTVSARVRGLYPVKISIKRGLYHNELTRFRYDVFLRCGEMEPPDDSDWQTVDFSRIPSIDSIKAFLGEESPRRLHLSGIPNRRVTAEVWAEKALGGMTEGIGDVEAIRAGMERRASDGLDPEDLWGLERHLPYDVEIGWAEPGREDCIDAYFRLREEVGGESSLHVLPTLKGRPDVHELALTNDPLRGRLTKHMIPELRRHADAALPAYMRPSAYVLLDRLPETPNRKIDRKALPAPESLGRMSGVPYAAPGTPTEMRITEIWSNLLGQERVGIRDNFFELGGHSLLATRVASRIRESFGIEIPVRQLFESPTVETLAAHMDALAASIRHAGASGAASGEDREEGSL